MYGELSATVRTTHHEPGHTVHHRRHRRLRGRVVAATAATLIAVGGGAAVAPAATAQGLPEPVQTSYDALPPDVQSIVGSVALSGPLGLAALYYFVWCPIVNGPWNPTPDSCSF